MARTQRDKLSEKKECGSDRYIQYRGEGEGNREMREREREREREKESKSEREVVVLIAVVWNIKGVIRPRGAWDPEISRLLAHKRPSPLGAALELSAPLLGILPKQPGRRRDPHCADGDWLSV